MKCGRNNDNFANFSYKLQDFQNIETNHRLYIDRGSVYWEQQASWENCTILEKLGLFVYVFLNTSYFSSASFVYFFLFCLHFRRKISIYLSDHSSSIEVYACKMCIVFVWTPPSSWNQDLVQDELADCLSLSMKHIKYSFNYTTIHANTKWTFFSIYNYIHIYKYIYTIRGVNLKVSDKNIIKLNIKKSKF